MATMMKVGSVTTLGNALLEAAAAIDTTPVKRELAAFSAIHRKWLAAQEKVGTAREKEMDARMTRGELDAEQDHAVDELARLLVGDGFNRTSPFKTFRSLGPTELKKLGDVKEARQAKALAAAVQKDKRASPATKKAAQALDKAATAVLAATQRLAPVTQATTAQRQQRDGLQQQWAKAWGVLKLAAKLAEASGGPPLASTLFPVVKRAVKGKAKPAGVVATPA